MDLGCNALEAACVCGLGGAGVCKQAHNEALRRLTDASLEPDLASALLV